MSATRLEAVFSPAEFAALRERDLSQTVCVVFDILRASTSMITALGNGAEAIIPVAEISEALAIRKNRPLVRFGPDSYVYSFLRLLPLFLIDPLGRFMAKTAMKLLKPPALPAANASK